MTIGQPHKGKSPYAKYGKRPTAYSALYQAWKRAVATGNHAEAARADRAWYSANGVRRVATNGGDE